MSTWGDAEAGPSSGPSDSRPPVRAPVRVLFLVAHPTIQGPLPKIAPLLSAGLRQAGMVVEESGWSRRREGERLREKVLGRLSDLLRVLGMLRRGRFDVLLVTTTHDVPALIRDTLLMLSGRRYVRGVILHFHGSMVDELLRPGRPLFKRVTRWLVGRAAAVLVLSEEEVGNWRRFAPNVAFHRVVNPFLPPPEAALPPSTRPPGAAPVMLFVGRLIAQKGVYDAVTAHALLADVLPCRLVIAGGGDVEPVRAAADAAGRAADVDVVGYVGHEGLVRLYREADVLVLPTYFGEGFPTVLSEAMAFGLPLVTTPIRGAADLLTEGENVVFVPPRDPPALAAAAGAVLSDSEVRRLMGEANRRRVREFAPEKVLPRYVEIIESVAKRP